MSKDNNQTARQLGRHIPGKYEDYVDFINYTFGFNGTSRDFEKLLPKLYRPELEPQCVNYVAKDNGQYIAAIGAYDFQMCMAGGNDSMPRHWQCCRASASPR